MLKFMFVGYRKADVKREAYFEWWAGDQHVSLVRQFPGLKKWVQNRVKDGPDGNGPDSVGEVWIENAEAFEQTIASEAWVAAFEDGKPYADIEKCYGFVVEEETIIE